MLGAKLIVDSMPGFTSVLKLFIRPRWKTMSRCDKHGKDTASRRWWDVCLVTRLKTLIHIVYQSQPKIIIQWCTWSTQKPSYILANSQNFEKHYVQRQGPTKPSRASEYLPTIWTYIRWSQFSSVGLQTNCLRSKVLFLTLSWAKQTIVKWESSGSSLIMRHTCWSGIMHALLEATA